MVAEEKDILVDIPDEDLTKLYELYEKNGGYPEACCAIDNGIKWRKKTGSDEFVFMSPNNSWRQDGTFILLMRVNNASYDIYVFTLDETCENLYKGLAETKRLDYRHRPHHLWFSMHSKFYPVAKQIMQEKLGHITPSIDCETMKISKEEALKFQVSYPPEAYLERLKPSDAEVVNEYWPHRFEGSVKNVEKLIVVNNGYGLYLKSNNKLVAWVLTGPLGQISLLQVLPEHMRRGYASVLINYPPEVYLERLKPSNAEVVNEYWPHRFEGSVKNVEKLISVNNGYGLYLKSNNKLVAWVLLAGPLGQISLLQVLPEHMRRGYASVLIKYISLEIAENGQLPSGTVLTTNMSSLNLGKKLGFSSKELPYYIPVPPN